MTEAIKIKNLKKHYGSHLVLKGLNFCVQQGEIFALLGVNGAGKTTCMECLEGLRKPDSGEITINGKMGIQLQSSSLSAHLKPLEAVKLFAKWNKTPIDNTMLDALGIYELAKKRYYQLSTGQKRRLHLALALTRNPDILFLDEPTAGLDIEVVLKNGIILNAPYSMFTDEQFSDLMSAVNICHILGRISFPIFCFLLVEGFLHTHSLKKYFFNLGLFAIISEPIYDLACTGNVFSLQQQNVLFTLLLGLIVIATIRKFHEKGIISLVIVAIGASLSYIFNFDGWYYGIALISIFYLLHDMRMMKYGMSILAMFVCGLDFTINGLFDPYFLTSVFSLVFISLYNGNRGIKMKYLFYIFYPLHLLILYLVSILLIKTL